MSVFAGDFPHRQNAHGLAVVISVQNSADFDASSCEALETFGHRLADFFDNDKRILDAYEIALRRRPRAEFRFAHTALPFAR